MRRKQSPPRSHQPRVSRAGCLVRYWTNGFAAPKKRTKVQAAEEEEDDEEEAEGEEDEADDSDDDEAEGEGDEAEDTAAKSGPAAKSNLKNKGVVPKEDDLSVVEDAE